MMIADKLSEKLFLADNGCWEFIGALSDGYGSLKYKGRVYKAHRVSWECENRPLEEGECVLHDCDNRKCCNPNHLFLGDKQDNSDDMIAKGRDFHPPVLGTMNGQSRLQEHEVIEIKKLIELGYSQQTIADTFNVSRSTIKKIKLGQTWGWLQ